MILAHLILAHNEPHQLERLVKQLQHKDAYIYIHLDKKTAEAPFEFLKELENVIFIKDRVKVYWGSYNIVQATLNGFKEIIQSGNSYQYINLLSGQDYPLKSQDQIIDFLTKNQDTAFMNFMPFEPNWPEALPRIQNYHFNNLRIPGRFKLQMIINKILPARKFPNGMEPVGRSQWFTIPYECVNYVLDCWESNRKLRWFIKLTWAPDEFIFQTILYNSPYKSKMVNNDLRYIDWSGGGVSPKTLTMNDAEALLASNAFFARKFDINKDAAVLDAIDQQIAIN